VSFERRLFNSRRAATRGATAIIIALVVGALLAARPLCFAYASPPGQVVAAHDHAAHEGGGVPGSRQPECCVAHADSLHVYVADTATNFVGQAAGTALARAALLVLSVAPISLALRSRSAPGALERFRPYHARTARMLR